MDRGSKGQEGVRDCTGIVQEKNVCAGLYRGEEGAKGQPLMSSSSRPMSTAWVA
jgi:hypothetical protein